ncbi:hypothetical protein [Frigoriglobus tundricola]|uniref:SMI1/KNR4 family protein n=1 Tax=Frigoriglobus tundricola TaxID=2774151 RepID=A0A6M5YWK3_9BACT|nr:hypothetical protein [Frigoriglobus tundricola]QJW97776.1 hypothetical protein FTUN_5356 [Frigoriglobus tundricola]
MTEEEWTVCADPEKLFDFTRGRFSKRKYRLFACACVRRVAHLIRDPRGRTALDFAERMADRGGRGRVAVEETVSTACQEFWGRDQTAMTAAELLTHLAEAHAIHAAKDCVWDDAFVAAARAHGVARSASSFPKCKIPDAPTQYPHDKWEKMAEEAPPQVLLLRDIFGNPYRPVAFDPACRTDTAVSLARQMYDSRDFGAMPILADALQDAGCENSDILNHCRDASAPHVRGCWVVDLVLGKS